MGAKPMPPKMEARALASLLRQRDEELAKARREIVRLLKVGEDVSKDLEETIQEADSVETDRDHLADENDALKVQVEGYEGQDRWMTFVLNALSRKEVWLAIFSEGTEEERKQKVLEALREPAGKEREG